MKKIKHIVAFLLVACIAMAAPLHAFARVAPDEPHFAGPALVIVDPIADGDTPGTPTHSADPVLGDDPIEETPAPTALHTDGDLASEQEISPVQPQEPVIKPPHEETEPQVIELPTEEDAQESDELLEDELVDESELLELEAALLDEPVIMAADRSAYVSVDHAEIVKANLTSLQLGTSTEVSDYTNGVNPYEYVQLKFKWSVILPDGQTFADGDALSIPLALTGWAAPDTAWVDLPDAQGTTVGQWRIENSVFKVLLTSSHGSSTIGSPYLSADIATGANYMRWAGYSGQYFVTSFTLGSTSLNADPLTRHFRSNPNTLNARDAEWKNHQAASNDTIQWSATLGQRNLADLWRNGGLNVTPRASYIEDTLVGAIAVSSIQIRTVINIPVSLNPGSQGVSTFGSWSTDVTSYFARQDGSYPSQTYEQYKLSLPAMSYGVYTAEDGTPSVVANYGIVGQDGPLYTDLDANFVTAATNQAIRQGYFAPEQYDDLYSQFLAAYGSSNSFGGRVAGYAIYPTAKYNVVAEDTPVPNTAYAHQGSSTTAHSRTATLQGVGSSAEGDPLSATVTKLNAASLAPVQGATFKLQLESSGSWSDYTPADGGPLLRQTDGDGKIVFANLGFGTYRFVETQAAPGYDITQTEGYDPLDGFAYSASFIISASDLSGHVTDIHNHEALTVIYQPGTQGTFTDDVHGSLPYDILTPDYAGPLDTAATNADNIDQPAGNPGYRFTGWAPAPATNVTQNAVYVAQWEPVPATPTPSPTPETTNTPTPSPDPTQSPAPSVNPTATPTASPTQSPTPVQSNTPTIEPSMTLGIPGNTVDPGNTDKPAKDSTSTPKTSDSSQITFWLMLAVFSGIAILLLALSSWADNRRKRIR